MEKRAQEIIKQHLSIDTPSYEDVKNKHGYTGSGLGKQTSFSFAVCSFAQGCRLLFAAGKRQKILLFATFSRGQKIVCFFGKAKNFAFCLFFSEPKL